MNQNTFTIKPTRCTNFIHLFWRETTRFGQNKFVKLVHLVGFIVKIFVTMQQGGHVDVKETRRIQIITFGLS
jgi:hypothetical protein